MYSLPCDEIVYFLVWNLAAALSFQLIVIFICSKSKRYCVNILSTKPRSPFQIILFFFGMNNNEKDIDSHELKASGYVCEECGRIYKSTGALKTHHKLKHQVSTKEDVEARTCKLCSKVLSSEINLRSHMKIHLGDGVKFKCQNCSYSTVQKTALIKHQMARHSDITFSCRVCSKSFKWEIDLQRHQLKHKGVKFTCEVCDKNFSEKRLLSLHKRTHHEKVVHKCNFDGCDFETTFVSSICTHKKNVHEGIIFYCEFCNYKSPRKGDVTRHMTSLHAKIKKHKCDYCDYRSYRLYSVKLHVSKRHQDSSVKVSDVQDGVMKSEEGRKTN